MIMVRADAHIHCFRGGYQPGFAGLTGVAFDEPALYAALAQPWRVRAALVVGFAGEPWCATNNADIADLVVNAEIGIGEDP